MMSSAAAAAAAATGSGPSTTATPVVLSFSANKLPSLDVLSASDPFVVVYQEVGRTGNWSQIGSTEVISNNANPNWTRQLETQWSFETEQRIKLAVFDYDGPGARSHDLIGEVTTTLGFLVAGRGAGRVFQLPRGGTLTTRCAEIKGPNARDTIALSLKGVALAKKDLLSLSDPFFVISRVIPDGRGGATKQKIFQSEKIDNTLNPVWKPISLPLLQLCGGDLAAPVEFSIWDHNSFTSHTLIGAFAANVHELIAGARNSRHFEVIKPKHVGRAGYKNSGTVVFTAAEIRHVPTLLEYIQGGLDINVTFAIDCTGSNGHPLDRQSLHYMGTDARVQNEYVSALTAVGNVVLPFDSDQQPVMLGFGGIPARQTEVNHCFPLDQDSGRPHVTGGIAGMVSVYQRALATISLSGPTYFAPLIRATAAAVARDGLSQEKQKYTIMVLMTDGACCDVEDTVNAIVDASVLPLSIIIIGVGDGGSDGFRSMDFLDADGSRLRSSTGRFAERDIVNFVPFRKFSAYGFNAGSALAKEVLAEVPGQVVSAMMAKGIRPNAPVGGAAGGVAPGVPGMPAPPIGAAAGAAPPPMMAVPVAPYPLPAGAAGAGATPVPLAAAPIAGGYGGYPPASVPMMGGAPPAGGAGTLRMPTFLPSAPIMMGPGSPGGGAPPAAGFGYPALPSTARL